MQSHQYPAMLHKTLFMAVWLFFLFFLLFPLSFPHSSFSEHQPPVWFPHFHFKTCTKAATLSDQKLQVDENSDCVLISLGEQKSKQRAVTSKITAGHAKFKLYPYKSTFEIAIKIKIKREKYMEDRVCTLHLFFSFLPQWFSILCLKWGLHIQQPKREQ